MEKKIEKKLFDSAKFVVFGGNGNHDLDRAIITEVNELSHERLYFHHLNIGKFPDIEPDLRITDYGKIRGKHVLIFQSAYSSDLANEYLDIAWAAKRQYGAKSVTGILTFMRFRRQDHGEEMSEINRNRKFCHDMATAGISNLILVDTHNLENTLKNCRDFGINAFNVDPAIAYAEHLRLLREIAKADRRGFYVYSPDEGSIPRAISLAKVLDVMVAVDLKERLKDGSIKQKDIKPLIDMLQKKHGVVLTAVDKRLKGSIFCVREDELSTGGTARLAGEHLRHFIKARQLYMCVTHPVCTMGWKRKLIDHNPFDNIFVGNTIPRGYENSTGGQMTTVDMSRVIAHKLIKVIRKFD